ncbi:uncharacterized MFS-type transporter C09D4.1 isoform X2 [Aethina tumida]|uniref:uncharacterized MFS-type transporter C09D4.1 isoform X2 n=1 Tax=Aethina tumida TaxID=116153 RepID=UPI002147EBCB|nr:uncharacterized MFS-type transporter C09D4.1 isoform X2 [Aethina tumida]
MSETLLPNVLVDIKTYRKRWLILFIYVLYSAVNSFQWMEYCIIENVVMDYYKVSSIAVDWTSIIYMAFYPVLVVPVSFIVDRYGLRVAALIGGLGTTLGVAIKVFSINPSLFSVVLVGQAIGSVAQVFVLCLPSKIAAVWFPPNEISTSCSLGIFGTQLGFALGFIVPSALVKMHSDSDEIGSGLKILCWGLTIFMMPVSFAILHWFQKEPKLPPSTIQFEERKKSAKKFKEFLSSFRNLLTDRGFLLHMTAYGINVAVFSSLGTFLNQFVLYYLPEAESQIGCMGFTMVVVGMVGSIVFGFILDKTRKYKESTLIIYVSCAISVIAFLFALEKRSQFLVYVSLALLGFFTNAYMPVGFEFAVEMTYPLDEGTTTGMLNAMTQGLGVFTTIILGELNTRFGYFVAILCQAGLMFLGSLITIFIPNNLKRQKALIRNEALLN